MPICHNCQCYTNDNIYPQWKPQGTTWCLECLDNHRQKMQIEFNRAINPLPEGITSIDENIICTG